jgi:hypothetical protein
MRVAKLTGSTKPPSTWAQEAAAFFQPAGVFHRAQHRQVADGCPTGVFVLLWDPLTQAEGGGRAKGKHEVAGHGPPRSPQAQGMCLGRTF